MWVVIAQPLNQDWSGIATGAINYFSEDIGRRITPFAIGFNKLFCCHFSKKDILLNKLLSLQDNLNAIGINILKNTEFAGHKILVLDRYMQQIFNFKLITQEIPMSINCNGFYSDNWVEPENKINLRFFNQKRINKFIFHTYNPRETMEINFMCNDISLGTKLVKDHNKIEFNLSKDIINSDLLISLKCGKSFDSDCGRKLSVMLLSLELNDS